MKRTIVGIQVHHSTLLADASRTAANTAAALAGAARATADPALDQLHAEAVHLARKIGAAQRASSTRLAHFYAEDPDAFARCRDGLAPWPDETVSGFEGRCVCEDQCAIHDRGRTADEGWICNCDIACPQHDGG